MATYATDLQTFDLCQTNGNFSELSGHTSGSAPAATSENYWQDGISVDQATGQAVGTNAGMECDVGTPVTWTATSNWVFIMSNKFDAGTNIYSWSLGGLRLGVGSSSGNINFFNTMGDDFRSYPKGGWQYNTVDPEVTPDTTEGTPVAGSYQVIGSMPNMRAKITKGSPHCIDAIRYGRGDFQVTGIDADFDGMAIASEASTAKWGLFDGAEWQGLMSLGLTGTSVTFSDSNKAFDVVDTPRVLAGFNKIEVNNIDSSVTWNTISIANVPLSITGLVPISKGDFEAVDNATINKNNCTFTNMGTFIYQSNSTLDNTTYRGCGLVTQGLATFTGCTFDKPSGTIGLTVDSLNNITKCTFNSGGTGHGVDLGTISTDISLNWDNFESGYTDLSSGDETILVSVDSEVTLTINVLTGASTPSVYNIGLGTVNVVAGQVTTTITVRDKLTKAVIPNAMVYVYADTGGGLAQGTVIINKVLTDVNGQVSDTRSLSTDQPILGRARKSTAPSPYYKTEPIADTIDSANGLNLNLYLILDE